MINDQGGIAGRKINFVYYDDAFNPAKTVEQTRRLIESDNVAFLFSMLGTAPNSAVVKYINANKVPHLFLSVNGDKWGDYQNYPWTMGFAPSSRTEAQIFAKYALSQKPDARFALLYQNDDLGKDFVSGLRDVLGARYQSLVTAASYEVTEPTLDSQIVALRATHADVLISGVTAKIRRPGDPQGLRTRLEADPLRHQRRIVGVLDHDAGRTRARPGSDHFGLHQGPVRSGMGRWRRDEGVPGIHGQVFW
jgi:branched-chain amino acid transport system substrate-binding protein